MFAEKKRQEEWEMGSQGERLDKAVSNRTSYTRKEVHALAGRGLVLVNGTPVRDCAMKVTEQDQITVDGNWLEMARFSYLMLNKPKGVVCATEDAALPTVLDLVPEAFRRKGLFPAGRLDKDTEGFVLITNDGALAHRILSPKSHVPKTYCATLDKPFPARLSQEFAQGVLLPPERPREGEKPFHCMPALARQAGEDPRMVQVVLRQGMYHQVRRMFAVYGLQVIRLVREKIGRLPLDPALSEGGCRRLTREELEKLEER